MYRSSQPRRCAASIIARVVSFFTLMEPMGSITTPALTFISVTVFPPFDPCRERHDRSERAARKGSGTDAGRDRFARGSSRAVALHADARPVIGAW